MLPMCMKDRVLFYQTSHLTLCCLLVASSAEGCLGQSTKVEAAFKNFKSCELSVTKTCELTSEPFIFFIV